MGDAAMLFDVFSRQLMNTPVIIVVSIFVMFGAIIYQATKSSPRQNTVLNNSFFC
jgi:hypothetical protein